MATNPELVSRTEDFRYVHKRLGLLAEVLKRHVTNQDESDPVTRAHIRLARTRCIVGEALDYMEGKQ